MNGSGKVVAGLSILILVLSASLALAGGFNYDVKPEILDALNRHDTTKVLSLLDENIAVDPSFAPNYLLKGMIFDARGDLDAALEQFDIALNKKSKLYEALYYKGQVFLEQHKIKEAEKAFTTGIKKSKDEKALFHNGMGLLLLEQKEYAKADVEFRKAINEGPDRAEFHANLGDANYFAEIYPLAISEYNKTIDMDTTFLDVYFRLARAYVSQNQYNKALDQLRVVLTRDSTYTRAWEVIGRLYTMAGLSATDRDTKVTRFTEALGSYRKFLELSHDSTKGEVFFNIGRSYYNLGAFPEADSAFEQVLKLGDVPRNIYMYIGRGYLAEEKYDEGVEMINKHFDWMKEQEPDWKPGIGEADLFRRIGEAYKAKQDWPNAADYFVRAFELDPTDARSAIEAAVAYHQMQDFAKALEYYEKRIELGPESWSVYLNASYCTHRLEEYEKTAQYLLKVVELDSTQTKAISLLADTYLYRLQDCENGVLWTKKWLEKDSTNCDALKSMGYAYFGGICPTNNLLAVDYFQKALSCYKNGGTGDCGNVDIIVYIAQAYHIHAANLLENDNKEDSKKYFKNAFDWYNKCLKCDPGNAECKKGVKDTEFEF